jgi:hypothetical protein
VEGFIWAGIITYVVLGVVMVAVNLILMVRSAGHH